MVQYRGWKPLPQDLLGYMLKPIRLWHKQVGVDFDLLSRAGTLVEHLFNCKIR